jgi:hypothetical protein
MKAKRVHLLVLAVILAFTIGACGQTSSGFPKCTDALSTVEIPSAPHGLYIVMFPGSGHHAAVAKYLMHNPVVCGGVFYIIWNKVDQGPGASPRYDWSSVDDEIAPWIAAGKQVNLIVFATGSQYYSGGKKVETTPSFVFAKTRSVECQSFGHVPVFWDSGYMSSYQEFMAAVVAKYGSNPAVGYIRFGLGAGGETFPACMYKLAEFGYSKDVWRKYLSDMLDAEKALNSPKLITIGLNPMSPPDLEFTASVAEHAVQDGIAIGNQGLSANDVRNYNAGKLCNAGWCDLFKKYRGKVPLVLQTWQFNLLPPDDIGPTMSEALPLAISLRTQILEIAIKYWLVGYDPSQPDYPAHHQEYQKAFEDAAKVLGGS